MPFAAARRHIRSVGAALVCSATLSGMLIGATQVPARAADGDPTAMLLKDIYPGTTNSSVWTNSLPQRFVQLGDKVLFVADDPVSGVEWRKTDGTPSGTTLVKDIRPGTSGAFLNPPEAAVAGGTLFFSANDGSSIGTELWKTDGTDAGTMLVSDINPSTPSSSPAEFVGIGNTIFFVAGDGIHGTELWKSDGTWDGTLMVKDILPGSSSSQLRDLTAVGNTVLFTARNSSTGDELWKSDGTEAGTVMVKDITPGTNSSSPANFMALGTTAYFSAYSSANGIELWKSDGTEAGTVMVKDIAPGSAWGDPGKPVVAGTTLYFSANDGTNGVELWKSDGTAAGTTLVKDIKPGPGSSLSSGLTDITALGSGVLFQANDGSNGAELWKSDGISAGTVLVKDIQAGTGSGLPKTFAVAGATAYFSATNGTTAPASGTELWQSDGTAAGTVLTKDINPGTISSSPLFLTSVLGTVFFAANDGSTGAGHGIEPWRIRANSAPVAGDDAFSTSVGSPRTVAAPGVLGNDTDADGDPLTAGSASTPSHGTVTLNSNGSFVYTPTAGYSGSDSFTYAVSDGIGAPDTATVTFTVAGTNQVPVPVADSYTTNEDTPLTVAAPGVLANDTDGNGDSLSASSASTPAHGTVTLNANGSFIYTPAANYNGSDSFTYVVDDGQAGTATGTVTISVTAVNDAPTAVDDAFSTTTDTAVTIPAPGVLGNDTDAEGDTLTAGSAGTPAHGTVTLNANGSFTYTPEAGFYGMDTFTYVASDPNGGSTTATVAMSTYGEGSVSSVRGSACGYSTTIGLFGGDQISNGCARPVAPTDGTYSPSVSLPSTGSPTTITATDPDGATAYLGPGPVFGGRWPMDVNSAPPSGPINVSVHGSPAEGTVTASADILPNDPPRYVQCYGEPSGTANCLSPGGYGPFPVEADSLHVECTATKDGVSGSTTFVNAELSQATTSFGEPIDIVPVPDSPPVNYTTEGEITVVHDFFTAVYNEQVWNADGSLTVTASHMYLYGPTAVGEEIRGRVTCGTNPHATTPPDTDPPTCRTPIRRYDNPPGLERSGVVDTGGLQSITNVQVTNGEVGIGTVPGSSKAYLRFVPGQTGPLMLMATRGDPALPMHWSFDATDTTGNVSHCTGIETPPTAVNDAYTVNQDTVLNVAAPGVLGNDSDADGDPLTVTAATGPAHGVVGVNPNGSFTYTPTAGYAGPDSFTYTAGDGTGGTGVGTVNVTVAAVNHAPVAVADSYTTDEDVVLAPGAPGVVGNDTDADANTLSAVKVTDPAHGSLTLNANGSFSYTPAANYNGPDSFTYKVNDGSLDSNVVTVSITVTAVNDAPAAAANTYSTNEDTPLSVTAPGVLGNDTDVEASALSAIKVSDPAYGSVTLGANGAFTYTPAANYNGPDAFTYKANDGSVDSNVATVSITVNPTNDAPVAVADAYTTPAGTPLAVSAPGVVANDTDVDGNALSAGGASTPASGSVTLSADGSFTYTPNAGFSGTDSFTYKANDGTADSNAATVSITVTPPAQSGPPALAINSISLVEGNAGSTAATFTVTRSGGTAGTSTASYKISGGTATAGTDYTAVAPTPITFGPTETTKSVTVTVSGDAFSEANETLNVVLSGPSSGTTLADSSGTATILNDDGAAYLSVDSVTVAEGNSASTPAQFTITRSGNTSDSATVSYKTSGGTALAGTDYTTAPLTPVTFAPGEIAKTVTVNVAGDTADEKNETFNLVLSAAVKATLADSSATATIVDDEGSAISAPTTFLSAGSLSVVEGNTGTTVAAIVVTRSGDTSGVSSVHYKTSGGTASASGDYTGIADGTLTFNGGETSKTVNVGVAGELLSEANETFNLVLSAATGGVISDSSGTTTILNDDGAAYVSVANVTVTEGNTGTTATTFTITRSGNTAGSSTVSYKTSGGTALAGTDYGAVALTPITFAAGETTKTVTVQVTGDTTFENNETFNLMLSAASGATISDTSATATIVNDD